MHRNTDIFGKDAEIFRPERWLTADAAKLSVMNRNWMPVSFFPRIIVISSRDAANLVMLNSLGLALAAVSVDMFLFSKSQN